MTQDAILLSTPHADLIEAFERFTMGRGKWSGLNNTPEEMLCAFAVDLLAPVIVEVEAYAARLAVLHADRHDIDSTVSATPSPELEAALWEQEMESRP